MPTKNNKPGTVYGDVIFFILAIPFINAFNYYLTYRNIRLDSHTILTFLIDTLTGYAAWWIIRSLVLYLDNKLPYKPHPLKRIWIQVGLTSAAALSFIIIITELVNAAARNKPVPASFYRFDIFIFLIWSLVVNGIYIGLHYYIQFTASEHLRNEERKVRQQGFIVKKGKQHLTISFDDIAGIYIEDNYAMLATWDGKKHVLDESLDNTEKQLPAELFFRLNRQYIMHRKMITGFERAANAKIHILLASSHQFPGSITMSRLKAPAFKTWFQQEQ